MLRVRLYFKGIQSRLLSHIHNVHIASIFPVTLSLHNQIVEVKLKQ